MKSYKRIFQKLCSVFIILTIQSSMFCMTVSSEISLSDDYSITNIFSDLDFESGEINPADFFNYAYSTKNGYGLSVVTDPDTESQVLKNVMTSEQIIYNGATTTIDQSNWQINYPSKELTTSDIKGHLIMEFDLKTESFIYTIRTMYVGSANPEKDIYCVGPLIDSVTGNLLKIGGGGTGIKMDVNKWYKFKFDFDVAQNTLDFYLDGNIIQENFALSPEFVGFKYFNLPRFMGATAGKTGTLYIDNCKLYTMTDKYTVSASTLTGDEETPGLDDFPLSGSSIKLTFSEKMTDITKEMFTFTAGGVNKDFDLTYNKDEKTVIITPSEPFKGREECILSFDGIVTENGGENKGENIYEFSVLPPEYAIKEVTVPTLTAGEDAIINVTINNRTSSERNEMVLVGIYNGNKLLSVGAASAQNPAGEDADVEVNLSVHPQYSAEDCKVRVFIVKPGTLFGYDTLTIN